MGLLQRRQSYIAVKSTGNNRFNTSHPNSEIWSGPPATCNSSFLHSLYFGYIMRGTVRARRTWMLWLEVTPSVPSCRGFQKAARKCLLWSSDNKRFFHIVEDWMEADICWRHSLIPQIPDCSIQVWHMFHPLICSKTGTVSWCLKNHQGTQHSYVDLGHKIGVNNVAEAVKMCRFCVCSHILTSWQIVLNPRRGWVVQNIWMWSKVRNDRVRVTATSCQLDE
jgi:hypothetical protein